MGRHSAPQPARPSLVEEAWSVLDAVARPVGFALTTLSVLTIAFAMIGLMYGG